MDIVVTFVIHYGGSFINHSIFDYVGGLVIEVEDIDLRKLSYIDIIGKLNEIGLQ